MQNVVALVGRFTKDPEVKVIGEKATAVCNFTLAVNRPYKNEAGEHEADFIQCQAWKHQAEFIGKYMAKGNLVSINGSINTRTYEVEGVTKYVTEVNVNQVQSLEKKTDTVTDGKETIESIQKQRDDEWAKRSVGMDAASKSSLKKELVAKYQPRLDKLDDNPF